MSKGRSTSTDGQRVMDLRGQGIVIPGGTSGISLATAKAVARCGAEVIINARDRGKIVEGSQRGRAGP